MSSQSQNNSYLEIIRDELENGVSDFENMTEIGSYSLDINRTFENSDKSLRYFVKPPDPNNVRFDLEEGFDTRKIEVRGEDISLLHWIKENKDKLAINQDRSERRENEEAQGMGSSREVTVHHREKNVHGKVDSSKDLQNVQTELSKLKINEDGAKALNLEGKTQRNLSTEFVIRRGLLTKIMLSPFDSIEGWLLAVTLHNGTFYINEIETERRKEQEASMIDSKTCCGGWKFEQYLTADCKNGKPNTDVPYNNCEAFYTVVKSQLNNHSLLYSGEVDAIDNDGNYLEFKTLEELHENHKMSFKRHKVKRWWAQSHLVGVKEIVCGFRDERGVVKRLEFFKTEELPTMQSTWRDRHNPKVCLNFLDRLLSFIKSSINIDDHKIVHTLQWSPPKKDEPYRIECSAPLTDSVYNVLPKWYIDATS